MVALGWRRVAQQRQRAQLASMVDVRPSAERSEGELEIASEGERWGVGSSASTSVLRREGKARGKGGRARGKRARQWRPRGARQQKSVCHCSPNSNLQFYLKIQLKPIFRASVTPKPRRVSKNSINKSYRSTYHLQLFLSDLGLIRMGYQVASSQSQAHRNCKLTLT